MEGKHTPPHVAQPELILSRTTGGKGGAVVNVASYAELVKACAGVAPAIIMVTGKISTPGKIRVASNKSIIGKNSQAGTF